MRRSIFAVALFALAFTSHAIASTHFLIVANGLWGKSVVLKNMQSRTVIALDGAAKHFHEANLRPDIILGDFDSIQEGEYSSFFNLDQALGHFKKKTPPENLAFERYATFLNISGTPHPLSYIRTFCQDYTDLEKAILFCLQERKKGSPLDIIICGAMGGDRIDHFLKNFSVLKKYKSEGVSLKIVTEHHIIQFLKDETLHFTGPIGGKFGAFGYPSGAIISKGLRWELDRDYSLIVGEQSSACNELKNSEVYLSVEGDVLIMRPNG